MEMIRRDERRREQTERTRQETLARLRSAVHEVLAGQAIYSMAPWSGREASAKART